MKDLIQKTILKLDIHQKLNEKSLVDRVENISSPILATEY